MSIENPSGNPLVGEPQLSPSAGEPTVGNVATQPTSPAVNVGELSLKEINETLGQNFPDKETAKKALKDTFSYVGKKKEDIMKEVSGNMPELQKQIGEMKENLFYKDHPEYTAHRALISKLGSNPEVVVQMPEFKAIFEQADGYVKSQNLRTVLESNPRIASSRDKFAQAKTALEGGNREEAETLVTRGVLESISR